MNLAIFIIFGFEQQELVGQNVKVLMQRCKDFGKPVLLKRGMSTTMSALLIRANMAFAVHVGDSRVYRLRDGRLSQLTEDHSLINELLKRGRLTPEQIAKIAEQSAAADVAGLLMISSRLRSAAPWLGSIAACAISTSRLRATKNSASTRIVPCSSGRSRWKIALFSSNPVPGQENTVSTRIEPPMR